MTEKEILNVIKINLGPIIRKAIADSKTTLYTEDWLAAMAMREMGLKIAKLLGQGKGWPQIVKEAKGDYSQRKGEKEKQYHGFGFWQIDLDSYREFVTANRWVDPYQCCLKAIEVLEEKRKYLVSKKIQFDNRAITAAYNCGQGNVYKAITTGRDVDYFTHQQNYSAEVWRYREIYKKLA